MSGETGDTLIEVLISAIVIVLVVVATIAALNNTNHATALDRERSQADALAQQDEDQLRSEPVAKLSELSVKHETLLREVVTGGTRYTITSTAQYKSDKTSTASCSSTSPNADYIQTSSEVTWHSLIGKPVLETSIISPPADAALIVQVTGASGEPVPHMNVAATGPTAISAETSTDGCAILAVLPGEYKINVSRTGYIDSKGYLNSNEDPSTNSSFYVVAETSVKKSYQFAPAGELAVTFTGEGTPEGDSFVAFNTGLSAPRPFGTVESYAATAKSGKTLFPFSTKYIVYAGTCEADLPTNNGQASNPEALVNGAATTAVNVPLVPIKMLVKEGTSSVAPGATMKTGVTGTLEDTGCKTVRKFTGNTNGELPRPDMPFGTYSLCLTATISGKQRRYVYAPIASNSASGVNIGTIYLGAGKAEATGCP